MSNTAKFTIDSLPNEIMTEVFRGVCAVDPHNPRFLSQVSSRWRNLATSDSLLWSIITLDIAAICGHSTSAAQVSQKIEGAVAFLKAVLDRSRERPLCVHVAHVLPRRSVDSGGSHDPRDVLGAALFRVLCRHGGRVVALSITTDLLVSSGTFIDRNAGNLFPRLRTLFLSVVPPSHFCPLDNPYVSASRQCAFAINLRNSAMTETTLFYLTSFGRSRYLKRLFIPRFPDILDIRYARGGGLDLFGDVRAFTGLTDLVIGDCPKRALFELTRRSSSSLRVCEVFSLRSSWCPSLKEDVRLPCLNTLTLPSGHPDLQQHFITPRVTQLVVHPFRPDFSPPEDDLQLNYPRSFAAWGPGIQASNVASFTRSCCISSGVEPRNLSFMASPGLAPRDSATGHFWSRFNRVLRNTEDAGIPIFTS